MDEKLAVAQAMKYAQELRQLHASERDQRRMLEEALERLETSYATTVRALAAAVELRDDETGGHAQRVTTLALELTRRVDPELAAEPQLEYGFLLHDLGKIGIPDAILRKPGRLDPDELEQMRFHSVLGERVIEQIPYLSGLARDVVACHHERWDGTGYPAGLRGTQIPSAARIFAVVDAYDAMTNDRPYRDAMPIEAALDELEKNSGTQFDPSIVTEFVMLVRSFRRAA
ncbi:MAG TPA: HD-GYP domain-containing protein [Gaiellaceae bacterium]|nr:HD-GYP domain-containing protein [Gaiellaceae bacterium]